MKKVHIEKDFFIGNRQNLVDQFAPKSLAIIVSNNELTRSGDQNFPFRQSSDFFYLTGTEQEKSVLALCPDHPDEQFREVLFVIKPNELLETWTGHKLRADEIKLLSGIKTVKWLDDFEMIIRDMVLLSNTLYFNMNEYGKYLPDVIYNDRTIIASFKDKYPLHHYARLAPLLTELRLRKSETEIKLIGKACEITASAFKRILKFVRPGVSEYEIEAELTHEFISQGGQGPAYQPIVASGKNALVLHYIENSKTCMENELLLLDFGAEYGNYAADCSRTIPVSGSFTARQKACYEAVLKVQKEAIKLFIPGNSIDLINKKVKEMMETEMIGLGLFTREEVEKQNPENPLLSKYLMHGVTHFIGLDVHDVGSKNQVFEKGMILTIEPGIYIPEEGIGIRIEDDILVDDTPFNLMAGIPKEVEEIEALMA